MINAVLAVVLAGLGLAVFGYLSSLLWQAVVDPLAGALERRWLRRCEGLAVRGDTALRDGRTKEALEAFVASVYAAPVKSAAMAAAVDKHHTGLLSRFIAASDRRHGENIGLLSLALADRVLRQRKLLQSSYVAALQTGNRKRRRDIEGELRGNSRELRNAIATLATEVLQRDQGASVH